MQVEGGALYHPRLIGMLEAIWGEGFLSPGGPEEVARLVAGSDLAGKAVLDIGCGAGGIDIALVRSHGAATSAASMSRTGFWDMPARWSRARG